MVAALKIGEGALRYSLDQGARAPLRPGAAGDPPARQDHHRRPAAAGSASGRRGGAVHRELRLGDADRDQLIVLALIVLWLGMTYRARRDLAPSAKACSACASTPTSVSTTPMRPRSTRWWPRSVAATRRSAPRHRSAGGPAGAHYSRRSFFTDSPECGAGPRGAALAQAGSPRAAVERLIADEDAVRAEAIRAFTAFGADGMTPRVQAARCRPARCGAAIVGVLQLATDEQASRARPARALDDLLTDAIQWCANWRPDAQGSPSGPLANRMLRLLSDPDPEVVRAAVRAVRRWNEREGTNFLFVPILICCCVSDA